MDKTKATVAWLSARNSPSRSSGVPMLPLHAAQPMKLGQQEDHNNLSSCSTNDSIDGQLTQAGSQGRVNANLAVSQSSGGFEALRQDTTGHGFTSETVAAAPSFS